MTNETDLNECSAQIKLVKQLLGPETFDLNKILVKLETKKKLLMTFKPRSYHNILEDLESGAIIHPGDWVKPPKEIEEKIDPERIAMVEAAKSRSEIGDRKAEEESEPKPTEEELVEIERLREIDKLKAEYEAKVAELESLKELEKEEEPKVTEAIGE